MKVLYKYQGNKLIEFNLKELLNKIKDVEMVKTVSKMNYMFYVVRVIKNKEYISPLNVFNRGNFEKDVNDSSFTVIAKKLYDAVLFLKENDLPDESNVKIRYYIRTNNFSIDADALLFVLEKGITEEHFDRTIIYEYIKV